MTTRRQFLSGLAALPFIAPVGTSDLDRLVEPLTRPHRLIAAARKQIGVTLTYDPAYVRLAYPGGDVDRSVGVCTDVIIRAYRDAFEIDLQKRVHEDMAAHFGRYPKTWGLSRTDRNIDHRRVPNLETFLTRKGEELPARDWQAGNLHTMRLDGRLPHIAIVSDQIGRDGLPMVIHNIGGGAREESLIGRHQNERRFRWLPDV